MAQDYEPLMPDNQGGLGMLIRGVINRLWKGKYLFRDTDTARVTFRRGLYQVDVVARGAGGTVNDAWPPVPYDLTQPWKKGDWIWVAEANIAVTTGGIDADTGLPSFATPGHWRCRKDTAPGSVAIAGVPTPVYHLPVLPYPTPDDATADNVYWVFISGKISCP